MDFIGHFYSGSLDEAFPCGESWLHAQCAVARELYLDRGAKPGEGCSRLGAKMFPG